MSALFQSATGLALRDPWMLLVLVIVAAALALRVRARAPAVSFATAALLAQDGERPPRSWRVRLLWLPRALYVAGLVCAAVALARPAERVLLPREARGIDVLLCLDVSSSMTARDLGDARTRLDVAKSAALEFVRGRAGDRIGLVTFARYADVRCPPTLDHDALAAILGEVAVVESDGPEDATGIGAATARAAQVLKSGAAKSKVVIVLTDGEENVALAKAKDEISPANAAQLCEKLAVRAYAVAVGAAGPAAGRGAIDVGPVRRMAERTGGRFYEARDAGAVAGVYEAIGALERSPADDARFEMEDRFLPFLLAALAFLAAGLLLESTALDVLP